MNIVKACINDLKIYTQIYLEYIETQIALLPDEKKEEYRKYNYIERNKYYINSPNALVYLVKDNEKIMGFIEFNIAQADIIFEENYVYISNIFFKKEMRNEIIETALIKELLKIGEKWARDNDIKYMCNDILYNNKVMRCLNKYLHYEPYKVRYYKKL